MFSDGDIKVVVSIDFGTTFSGYAYAHKYTPEEITVEDKWPGSVGHKTPTVIRYQDELFSAVKSWGFPALHEKLKKKGNDQSIPIELFKLFLLKESLIEKPSLPDKLDYRRAITDYLKQLSKMIKEKFHSRNWPDVDFYRNVLIVLTIPAEVDDDAIETLRDCAFNAELIKEKGSTNLTFTTEPEAAAIYCLSSLEKEHNLKPKDSFMIVDCGGGTVDLTRHELLENSKLSEITERTGEGCGSSFVDKKFIEFLRHKLGNSTVGLLETTYCNVLRCMVQEFCDRVKIPFTGQNPDFKYEIDVEDYPLKRDLELKDIIEEGKKKQLSEDGWLIKVRFDDVKGMFDPIIEKIILLIKRQLAQQADKKCSAIMLVGGFSESEYLQARIKKEFNEVVSNISVPSRPTIAVIKGGVKYGLQMETMVNRVLKRTYGTNGLRRTLSNDPPLQILPSGFTIIFETLARRGNQVSADHKVVKKFKPQSLSQRGVNFDIYVTKEYNAKFCDDSGVKLLRQWEVQLPENDDNDDIIILLTLTFGTIEILATAEIQKAGKKYQVQVNPVTMPLYVF